MHINIFFREIQLNSQLLKQFQEPVIKNSDQPLKPQDQIFIDHENDLFNLVQ